MFGLTFLKPRASSRMARIEAVVDKNMMVNSSLVDNEFSGADLPCRVSFSFLRNPYSKMGLSAAHFLASQEPEECTVRWLASFLSRFGSQWLICTKKLEDFDARSGTDDNNLLCQKLGVLIACSVTHRQEKELEDGTTSAELVSILSPLHMICSDVLETWNPTIKVTDKACLPYQTQVGNKCGTIYFGHYITSIQNALSAWHKDSLNELEDDERDAVQNMKPHQLACFSKLMEEQDSHELPILKQVDISILHYKEVRLFLWQVGYHSDPFKLDFRAFQEVLDDFLAPLPVLDTSLEPGFFDAPMPSGRHVLQASVHADNCVALEAGQFPFSYAEAQNEVSEPELEQWGKVFSAQRRVELRRLQHAVARGERRNVHAFGKVKFLGCVIQTVRNSLSFWLDEASCGLESEGSDANFTGQSKLGHDSDGLDKSDVDWTPSVYTHAFPCFAASNSIAPYKKQLEKLEMTLMGRKKCNEEASKCGCCGRSRMH